MDWLSPDWLTEASMPAYAASFAAVENLAISPISPRITAAVTSAIPGIVLMGESILSSLSRVSEL